MGRNTGKGIKRKIELNEEKDKWVREIINKKNLGMILKKRKKEGEKKEKKEGKRKKNEGKEEKEEKGINKWKNRVRMRWQKKWMPVREEKEEKTKHEKG